MVMRPVMNADIARFRFTLKVCLFFSNMFSEQFFFRIFRVALLFICQGSLLLFHFHYFANGRNKNGEGGIRTHAPLRTNGFQDRLVMTTSIPLHNQYLIAVPICHCFFLLSLLFNTRNDNIYYMQVTYICQQLFSIFFKLFFLDPETIENTRFFALNIQKKFCHF